tara:strand:+ start:499 stop:705 length:207 start_codon:yes stop_codon:yes gene_type:complete
MINSTYIYLLSSSLAIFALFFLYFNLKPDQTHRNNKIILKDLLESLDLELPDELKHIDNSSTDPQKFS